MNYIYSILLLLGLILLSFLIEHSKRHVFRLGFLIRFRNHIDGILDYILPSATVFLPKQIENQKEKTDERIAKCNDFIERAYLSTQELSKANNGFSDKEKDELDRIKQTEGKLSSLLTLSGVMVTAALALTNGKGLSSPLLHVLMSYCILQLVCLLSAVKKGLERQVYWEPKIHELMLFWFDENYDRRKQIEMLKVRAVCLESNIAIGNHKVTQLAVAHQAFRNFIFGVCLVFISLCFREPAHEYKLSDFMDDLERHPLLHDVLKNH